MDRMRKVVFLISDTIIDDTAAKEILLQTKAYKQVMLDMKNVEAIESDLFINHLLKGRFRLFNLNLKVLLYLSIVLKNGFLYSFMNYKDCLNNKRGLYKRQLKVV